MTTWRERLRWNDGWRALALLVVVLCAYQPAWHGAAVFDDDDHFTPPELASAGGLARIWTEPGAVSQYYPVTHTAFWVMNRLWGHETTGYHFVNLVLHAFAAWMFGRLLGRLGVPGAWFAAAVFALHPVHVESVAWISELKNTLSTALVLASAHVLCEFDERRGRGAYGGALGLFVLALLAKSVVAVLPAAWLVILWWRRGRIEWRRDVGPLLPFFVLGTSAGLLTAWMERNYIGAEGADFLLAPSERLIVAGRAVWFYAGKLLWPADLALIYPRWETAQAPVTWLAFPVAALAAVTLAWMRRHRTRGPLAGLLLFGGMLFPVLGFLNVYPFVYSFVADHYQYLASLAGIAALAAAATLAVRRVPESRRGLAGRTGAVLVAAVLGGLTHRESARFADGETLWRATLARNPAAFVAHANLGQHLLERGAREEALGHARRAVALRPDWATLRNNLGHVLLALGRDDEALAEFQAALGLQPTLAVAHFNCGTMYLRAGRPDAARTSLTRAVRLRPEFVRARVALAGLCLDHGDPASAAEWLAPAAELRPDDPDVNANLGNAFLALGRVDEALACHRRVVAVTPESAAAQHNLAASLRAAGRKPEADAAWTRALALSPEFVPALVELGRTRVEDGRPAEAVAPLRRVIALSPTHAVALNALGAALMQTGAPGEATDCFRAAVRAAPDFALARDNLARALELFPAARAVN